MDEDSDMSFEFHQLKNELDRIWKDEYEKKAFDYFDIVSWLESKLSKKKFADVVREKSEIDLHELKAA